MVLDLPKHLNNDKMNTKEIKLIEGVYNPEEAAEILFTVVNDKIKYHNIQINSCIERNTIGVEHSENRLVELAVAKEKISDLVNEAREKGAHLELSGEIKVNLRVNETAC